MNQNNMRMEVLRNVQNKKPVNPSAKKALDQLKEETAAEIGLTNYRNMYKGALTSADNGRVGGHMVRKMIQSQQNQMSGGRQGQQGQRGQQGQPGQGGNGGNSSTLTSQYDPNQ